MKLLVLLFSLFLASTSLAVTKPTFVPPNNLNIPVNNTVRTDATVNPGIGQPDGLSKSQYDTVLNHVFAVYSPFIKSLGGQYIIVRSWDDGTVNAQAWRDGDKYNIEMFGGLARYKGMSMDAFAIVACHETGHHLGGAPLYPGDVLAAEGQADYFATEKCLKNYFRGQDTNKIVKGLKVDQFVVEKCAKATDLNTCIRESAASQILSDILADLGGEANPNFNTPDLTIVTETNTDHPAAQCRLDTMFHGALCKANPRAKTSQTDPNVAYCPGKNLTSRPLCWYSPGNKVRY